MSSTVSDPDLKARHRAMWASGDYPGMAASWLLPLGPRLVGAAAIGSGDSVLDVAAGSGNTAIPAAQAGATVVASDLVPELLAAGARRPEAQGLAIEWVTADAEHLPFEDESFDVVMSSIGVMFAPHHRAAADELVRVCRPGGRIALLCWTPEGWVGGLFRTMAPFAPPPPPGAQPAPLWGSEAHLDELFGDRVDFTSRSRGVLATSDFPRARDFADHFRDSYGPTLAARRYAEGAGRLAELDAAFDAFFESTNAGDEHGARFELEYLVAVATRR